MPLYDYHCEANGRTIEVEHPWSLELKTWGELLDFTNLENDGTPREARIERWIGLPKIVRQRTEQDEDEDSKERERQFARRGLHPMGCPCCFPMMGPGISAFQEKLRQSLIGKEDDEG